MRRLPPGPALSPINLPPGGPKVAPTLPWRGCPRWLSATGPSPLGGSAPKQAFQACRGDGVIAAAVAPEASLRPWPRLLSCQQSCIEGLQVFHPTDLAQEGLASRQRGRIGRRERRDQPGDEDVRIACGGEVEGGVECFHRVARRRPW